MRRLFFNSFEDLAYEIDDEYDILEDNKKVISIIAKYEEARKIISELLCIGYDIRSISELEDPEFNGYIDEYIISITNIDEAHEIWCEPMKRDSGYVDTESTITYILDNCSHKVISHCESDIIYEVAIEDTESEDEDEIDCDECDLDECACHKCDPSFDESVKYSKDNSGNLHGFTASKSDGNSWMSYSVYTTDKLSKANIQSLLQEAGF